jgi:hypothetical protein
MNIMGKLCIRNPIHITTLLWILESHLVSHYFFVCDTFQMVLLVRFYLLLR